MFNELSTLENAADLRSDIRFSLTFSIYFPITLVVGYVNIGLLFLNVRSFHYNKHLVKENKLNYTM